MMIIEKEIKKVIKKIKDTEVMFSRIFLTKITEKEINKLNNEFSYIYVIKGKINKEYFGKEYNKLKSEGYKLPKFNGNGDNYDCLYVGTSKSIRTRLKQHFIKCNNKTTDSLHFGQFANIEQNIQNLEIELFQFNREITAVKCYEIELQKILKPLLGQKSIR